MHSRPGHPQMLLRALWLSSEEVCLAAGLPAHGWPQDTT